MLQLPYTVQRHAIWVYDDFKLLVGVYVSGYLSPYVSPVIATGNLTMTARIGSSPCDTCDILLATVWQERGTFSNASFFPRHSSSAESNKHSLTNSPSGNGLPFLAILWNMTYSVLTTGSLDMFHLVKIIISFFSFHHHAQICYDELFLFSLLLLGFFLFLFFINPQLACATSY